MVLKFIKSIFKKEEEPIKTLTLSDADKQIKDMLSEENTRVENLLSDQRSELDGTKALIEERLEDLEKAELRNANITTREVQFMKGNRENFLRHTRFFLSTIKKPPSTEEELINYQIRFKESIQVMRKSTKRSYMVLQDFFKDEAGKIAHAVSSLEKQVHSLANMHKTSSLPKLKAIANEIHELQEKISYSKHAEKEKKKHIELIEKLKEKKKKTQDELNKFLSSKEYKELTKLKSKKTKVREELNKIQSKWHSEFAKLDRAFRKYEHICMDADAMSNMMKNAVGFSMTEPEKAYSAVIEPMSKSIDKLGLKDKKLEKTKAVLNGITLTRLTTDSKKVSEIKNHIEEIENQINQHPGIKKSVEYTLNSDNAKLELERTEQKINQMKKPIKESQITEQKNAIGKKMNEMLEKEILIF